jgi:hypothetical protein
MAKGRAPLLVALIVVVAVLGLGLAWQTWRSRRPAPDQGAAAPAATAPAAPGPRAPPPPRRGPAGPARPYATPPPEAPAQDDNERPASATVSALLDEARAQVRAAAARCPIEPNDDRRARLELRYGIVVESNMVRLVNVEPHGGDLEEGPLRTCLIEHIVAATWRTTVTEHALPVVLEDAITVAAVEDAKRR